MSGARRIAPILAGVGALFALTALTGCITTAESGAEASTIGTVSGVGQLPVTNTESSEGAPPSVGDDSGTSDAPLSSDAPDSTGTEVSTAPPSFGERAGGNRLLMIGDSLTASISQRYGGQACDGLVPLGWQLEVDAETGRFIDFGQIVLNKRLAAGWDAFVVFLGNNYGHDKAVYQSWLHGILERTAPKPTVLLTTTVFRPDQAEVNEAITAEAALFPNVSIIDWATITASVPGLTGNDGLHLTDDGRRRLGFELAAHVGTAPAQPGKCVSTSFKDDRAGSPDGPAGNTKPTTKPTGTTSKPTGTTAKPTATTAKPNTPVTTATPSQSTSPPSTSPPSTAPPSTSPQSTSPQSTTPGER
ncbi:MAG TPA: hypothetical protein VK549_07140 [Acidimicrobiia bacterium]|nr:hypothetical protein [Acidimicrobiia bacterium]